MYRRHKHGPKKYMHDASVAVAIVPTLMCVARRGTYPALAKLASYITLQRERESIIVEEASIM